MIARPCCYKVGKNTSLSNGVPHVTARATFHICTVFRPCLLCALAQRRTKYKDGRKSKDSDIQQCRLIAKVQHPERVSRWVEHASPLPATETMVALAFATFATFAAVLSSVTLTFKTLSSFSRRLPTLASPASPAQLFLFCK